MPEMQTMKQKDVFRQPLIALITCCFVALGCGGRAGTTTLYGASVNRLKSLNQAVLLYASDFDDVLPLRGQWMDGVIPYAKNEWLFHSPAVSRFGYGYAMQREIAGNPLHLFSSLSTEVSVFDSTNLARNATDFLSTEPSPPRYGRKNTIAFLDGHVQDENTVGTNPPSLYSQSKTRLKHVNLALLMYANDWDSALPLTHQWVDELTPYVRDAQVFHSPAVQLKSSAQFGYALSSETVGINLASIASPSSTISVFDSTDLTRNATAPTSTLPNPPRYQGKNTIGYVDGHLAN